MPVSPPAASARSKTVGNQSRARRCLRCSGGVLIIALGEYLEIFEVMSLNFYYCRFPIANCRFDWVSGKSAIVFFPNQGALIQPWMATWVATEASKIIARKRHKRHKNSIMTLLAMGATGFDRNLNDRRDACRATLCSSLKRVGKNNCQ